MVVKSDLDGVVEQDIQHPDLELTAFERGAEIRYRLVSHTIGFTCVGVKSLHHR